VDEATARSVALIAAALNHFGTAAPPAQLISETGQYAAVIMGTPGPAAQMTLSVKGAHMITVDSVNEVATLSFGDRDNDPVAPPAGTIATATSSDTAVMTVGTGVAATDPVSGVAVINFPLAAVAEGTTILSAHATAADGSPLLGPDGTTPIPDPAPVTVTVNPGAAAQERFVVQGA
jgi:hypothetical protein